MAPSIRVIGSLNVDMVTVTPRFPGPGETLTATSFSQLPGGKGANQAVACGRLSRNRPASDSDSDLDTTTTTTTTSDSDADVDVEMIGAVGGKDAHFASILRPVLARSGVRTPRVRTVETDHTGVAVITVDSSAGGENRILFSPGANYSGMQPTDAVLAACLAPPLPAVLVLQCEVPTETVVAVLRRVRDLKKEDAPCPTQVVFNPAPAPVGGLPADVWAAVDHLVLNETEAEIMAPQGIPADAGPVGSHARRVEIAKYYHGLGVRVVVVTLGAAGLWYSAADPYAGGWKAPPADWLRVTDALPAVAVENVVDTTAAGDTWVGAYAVRMAQFAAANGGKRAGDLPREERRAFYAAVVKEAAAWAAAASAVCVQRPGAMVSIPFRDEVETQAGVSGGSGSGC